MNCLFSGAIARIGGAQKRASGVASAKYSIREILGISTKEYTDNLQIMRAYENVKILF